MIRRPNRTLSALLFLSVALNLFLGGVLASHWLFRPPPWDDGGPGDRLPPLHRLADGAGLDPPYRDQVTALWLDQRPRLHRQMRAVREARRQVHRLLTAETLDRAALATAQETLSQRLTAARAAMQDHLLEVAALLPPEQRRAYFEAGLRRHHGPRGRGPGGRPGCDDAGERRPGDPPSAGSTAEP